MSPSQQGGGGGGNLYRQQTGVCHFDQKSSTQKSGNLPKIETQKSGNLPKIETQKSGNPKRQAFLLHEKTYHPPCRQHSAMSLIEISKSIPQNLDYSLKKNQILLKT